MKTIKFIFLSIIFVFNITISVKSQIIDSLKIIPINPTILDSIKIISHITYPHSPCYILNSSITNFDSIIQVNTSHYDSINAWTAICHSSDTLTLGKYSVGTYKLRYQLFSDTAPTHIYDKDSIFFTIKEPNNIQILVVDKKGIKVYPNPTTDELFIELKNFPNNNYTINIYSSIGQKIRSFIDKGEFISINISNLKTGIYHIVIIDENKSYWSQKIIKNEP